MVRQIKTLEQSYKPYLCWLMAYVDGVAMYPRAVEFSQEQLLALTPDVILPDG